MNRVIFALAICASQQAHGFETILIGDDLRCSASHLAPASGGHFRLAVDNLLVRADDPRVVGWNENHSLTCMTADGLAYLIVPNRNHNVALNALEVSRRL